VIDTIKGQYNTAFFKFIVSILITILLNALCQNGMSIISWLIVFIPFIFMTVIVTMLLYIFGLDASTGKLQISSDKDQQSGNLIFSTSNSNTNTTTTSNTTNNTTNNTTTNPNSSVQSSMPDFESSDPQYESFHTLHS
jgi:hypothetical protein